jgi:hypothetical protein
MFMLRSQKKRKPVAVSSIRKVLKRRKRRKRRKPRMKERRRLTRSLRLLFFCVCFSLTFYCSMSNLNPTFQIPFPDPALKLGKGEKKFFQIF